MKNELEILLIGLDESGMEQEKGDLIDALSLLQEEVNRTYAAMSNKMKTCIDEDDESTLSQLMQTRKVIPTIHTQINKIKSASKYENTNEADVESEIGHSLSEDMTGKTPWKIVIDGKEQILETQTWRCLFRTVMTMLAEMSPQRFNVLANKLNREGLTYCSFAEKKEKLRQDYPIAFIEAANLYMSYQGDANAMSGKALEAISFFNLQNTHKVFVSGKIRKIKPN